MKEAYLEVTFRHGRALAAYYYLPRRPGQRSYRTVRLKAGLLVDFGRNGRPIGIEITTPGSLSLATMNRALKEFGLSALSRADLRPLRAA